MNAFSRSIGRALLCVAGLVAFLPANGSAAGSFTISVNPASRSVVQGSAATYAVTAQSVNGFSGTVSFAGVGLPAGYNTSNTAWSSLSLNLGSGGTATSTFTLGTTAASAITTSSFTLRVTGGGITKDTTASVTVSHGQLTISMNPLQQSVSPFQDVTLTVVVRDPQGSPIGDAQVPVFNDLLGLSQSVTSDSRGQATYVFTAPRLRPGQFSVRAGAAVKSGYESGNSVSATITMLLPTYGTTIITHGWEPGPVNPAQNWMMEMGVAVLKRAGAGNLWYYSLEQNSLSEVTPTTLINDPGFTHNQDIASDIGEQVIIMDWSATSGMPAPGYAEAAGHALYSLLMGGAPSPSPAKMPHQRGFVRAASPRARFHFIGHSFGTVVNSEAIRRLGALENVTVDQMTTLDAHDWDQKYLVIWDTAALLPDVQVWRNVVMADNYYNTSSGPAECTPYGRRIKGSQPSDGVDLTHVVTGNCLIPIFGGNAHEEVHAFYHGTIDPVTIGSGSKIDGVLIQSGWYAGDHTQSKTGYVYSRLGGSHYVEDLHAVCRIDPITMAVPADHPECLSPQENNSFAGHGARVGDIVIDPQPQTFFGRDFSGSQWTAAGFSVFPLTSIGGRYPGYRQPVVPAQVAGTREYAAELTNLHAVLETNLNYVPIAATTLQFQLKVNSVVRKTDTLEVSIDGRVISTQNITAASNGWAPLAINISSYGGKSVIFKIELRGHGPYPFDLIDSVTWIDKITIQ
jgi:hypothetical protein